MRRRSTVGGLMVLVGLAGVSLGTWRWLEGTEAGDWRQRIVVAHVVGMALAAPMATGWLWLTFVAGEDDPRKRAERGGLVVGLGCCAWVFLGASLGFWAIIVVVGAK